MPLYGTALYGAATYGAATPNTSAGAVFTIVGGGAVAYEVSVGFSGTQTGTFVLGTSVLGGPDVLAGAFAYPTWVDITADVQQVDTVRGRADDLATVQAGTCTLTLKDTTGKYSPDNASGPYYGQLVPLRPVRVRGTQSGVIGSIFTGWVTDITSNPDRGTQKATIQCKDLFAWMDQDGALPTIPPTGPTTTGAAIGLILDAVGWTAPGMRRLAVGDRIPSFAADGKTDALTLVGQLLDAERGVFYIAADGTAVYEDRAARNRAPRLASQATITSAKALFAGVSLQTIKTRASVTRTGGVAQVAADLSAFGFPRDFPAITTPYLATDAQAMALARYMVATRKDPVTTARSLDLDGLEPTALAALLSRDLSDRITVTDAPTGTSADFHVEQIVQRIAIPGRHTGSYKLSKRPTAQPFILGQSVLGGPDILTAA